ncbi:Mitochondrial import receptor subunit TOM20 -like protein [Halotydeus destructor]|nr:Mitochondrial import receptor subunit TOM20 -like protein [Halotydeus destructor]
MASLINNPSFRYAAVAAGGLFAAYCVYFDHKRRSDPLFKQKLRERREQARKQRSPGQGSTEVPDLRNYEAVQKFFIQEVQVGEELLAIGDVENGVEHLANAVTVCGQPQQLLQVLGQTLPPQIFHLLLQRLPIVAQKLNVPSGAEPDVEKPSPALNPLDDLE